MEVVHIRFLGNVVGLIPSHRKIGSFFFF